MTTTTAGPLRSSLFGDVLKNPRQNRRRYFDFFEKSAFRRGFVSLRLRGALVGLGQEVTRFNGCGLELVQRLVQRRGRHKCPWPVTFRAAHRPSAVPAVTQVPQQRRAAWGRCRVASLVRATSAA